MGRRPIGKVAMTGVERVQRYRRRHGLTKAETVPARELAQAKARIAELEQATGLTLKVEHMKIDPIRVMRWVRQKIGYRATLAVRDAADQALRDSLVP